MAGSAVPRRRQEAEPRIRRVKRERRLAHRRPPLAELLAEYEAQCARSNEIVAAADLDDAGRHPDFRDGSANLRWMLIHLVEETGRHAGHADIVRELLDGTKGYY